MNCFWAVLTGCLMFSRPSFCQKEAYVWNFGLNGASMSFSSGQAVATNTASELFKASEGCTSACDANGNLLFYSNGVDVFTNAHVYMPNGRNLNGAISSNQSCFIVAQPGSQRFYYIFTSDCYENQFVKGYQYSIVDMSLNGGHGDVISKNNLLHAPGTEKLTAALHSNGRDIWILTHAFNSNTFYAYLLTPEGLDPIPVLSSIGSVHVSPPGWGDAYRAGLCGMKTSSDSRRLAVLLLFALELFDFDRSTGKLSNVVSLTLPADCYYPYSLEFSPGGSKLYVNDATGSLRSKLYQYDLSAGSGSAADIENTAVKLFPLSDNDLGLMGSMQNGPDGRLYIPRPSYGHLSVINNPEAAGLACTFADQGVAISPPGAVGGDPNTTMGMSNFPSWYFQPPVILSEDTCADQAITFRLNKPDFIQSVQWTFTDSASGSSRTLSSLEASYMFPDAGTYYVTADITYYYGGTRQLSQTVHVHYCCRDLAVPTLITPNGDGLNDTFYAGCIYKGKVKIDVYNQWGQLVYRNTNYKNQWSAEGLSDGLYYVLVDSGEATAYKGWLQIMR